MNNFLEKIKIKDCAIQIGKLKVIKNYQYNDSLEHEKWVDKEDIYFLSGLRTDLPDGIRGTKDTDVVKKNLLFFDFDVRNNEGKCNDEQLDATIKDILTDIDRSPIFSSYSYAVNSGNGLHLFYFGDTVEVTDKNVWKAGMQELNDRISEIYPSDHGCVNAGRIMRFPECINGKTKGHSKILVARDVHCEILGNILNTGTQALKKKEEKAKIQAEEAAKKYNHSGEDTFARINNIPIEDIVAKIYNWSWDGKKNWRRDGETATVGCFKHETANVLVHGGTSEFEPLQEGYSPFSFIKQVKALSAAETFNWFEKEFPGVKEVKREYNAVEGKKEEATKDTKGRINYDPIRMSDLMKKTPKANPYIVREMIPEEGVTEIFGSTGGGKSLFTLYLADCVSRGLPVFDERFKTKKSTVLLVDLEMNENYILTRALAICGVDTDIIVSHGKKWKFDEPESIEFIKDQVRENDIKLVIFDTYSKVHNQSSEDKATEMTPVMELLNKMTQELKISIIIIHHVNKGDGEGYSRSRGSTAIPDNCVSCLQIATARKTEIINDEFVDYNFLTISHDKQRDPENFNSIGVKVLYDSEKKKTSFKYEGEVKKNKMTVDKAKDFVIESLKRSRGYVCIEVLAREGEMQNPKVSEKAIRSALKELPVESKTCGELVDSGQISEEARAEGKISRKRLYYRLNEM